jgi:GPH family glycoside/pentoside/hexuronide:cation symporter
MKLDSKTKFGYGLAGVGDSALYTLIGTFLLFFLNTVIGINPAVAGTIAAVGAVWEAVCGSVVGYISDRTYTRFGRRKPFLLFSAFPLAIFTSLLFSSTGASQGFKTVYYALMLILFWTAFAFFFIPYYAWGAELTKDYDERTVLRGYTYVCNTVGMAFGMILPTIIVDFLMTIGADREQGWQGVGIFCGTVSMITIIAGAIMIKDESGIEELRQHKKRDKGVSLLNVIAILGEYRQILKLKSTRYVVGASIAYLIGYSIFCADRMYFLTFNMGFTAAEITAVLTFLTFSSVIFVPVVSMANRRYGKRTIFIFGMCICGIIMFLFRFIGFDSVLYLGLFILAYSIGSICYWQLVPSMIYDVCEVDELVYNKKRAGIVISLQSISESASNALGLQIVGLLLAFGGFNAEAVVQTKKALSWTSNSFSLIPAVLMLVSAFMIFLYPITKKNFKQVVDAIERRDAGQRIDLEPFKKLI